MRALALALALASVGCGVRNNGEQGAHEVTGANMGDQELIRRAFGRDIPDEARVRQDQEGSVGTARLYTVEGDHMRPFGAAVLGEGDNSRVLRGLEAFRTLRSEAKDARTLARLSILFVEKGQAGAKVIPTIGPASDLMPDEQARVGPPTAQGASLVYWRWPVPTYSARTTTAPEPRRCRLDLVSYQVNCERRSTIKDD